ncbi:MAG TPA: DinB family protein [Bacteroidia bacterium]|jgi:uncharacterized damage-inducible protein DinB|nr:DinB family protein [Bacteroidia bacterium]
MKRPEKSEYTEFFEPYIKLIPGDTVLRALESQMLELQALVSDLPTEKEDYAYAPGKWTIKEVIGHLIDCERVFGYRVLRFARGDSQALPGFNEKEYVPAGKFNKRSFYDLAHEFSVLREANIILVKNLDEEALSRKGNADNRDVTVRALVYSIAGHSAHHVRTIKSRYLE